MRILILALGTRGDFELFLLLGKALRLRGHDVTIASSADNRARVVGGGLRFEWVAPDHQSISVATMRELSPMRDKRQRTYEFFRRALLPQLKNALPIVCGLASSCDFFVSNLKIALRKGNEVLPCAAVTYDPPADLAELAMYKTSAHKDRVLDLVALSRPLVDPSGAWGSEYMFTGFWMREDRDVSTISQELAWFLGNGPSPVVATMGSMVSFDPKAFAKCFADALSLIGRRGVLVGGWSGLTDEQSFGKHLHITPECSYGELFPQAACVLHHGGTGTVSSVLRAGKVSIVLPQILAQEHFANHLLREQLATAVLEINDLTSQKLADAIDHATHNAEATRRASTWSQTIADEPGVTRAAELIEQHAARFGEGDSPAH